MRISKEGLEYLILAGSVSATCDLNPSCTVSRMKGRSASWRVRVCACMMKPKTSRSAPPLPHFATPRTVPGATSARCATAPCRAPARRPCPCGRCSKPKCGRTSAPPALPASAAWQLWLWTRPGSGLWWSPYAMPCTASQSVPRVRPPCVTALR